MTAICVIGVGNTWASDDGIAPVLVNRVRARYSDSDLSACDKAVSFIAVPFLDVSLLNVIAQCETVILVDAVKGNTGPGTIHRQVYQPDLLVSKGVERASSHGIGVREILALAAALDRLPDLIVLWGVEVITTGPGNMISSSLSGILPDLERQLFQDLRRFITKSEVEPMTSQAVLEILKSMDFFEEIEPDHLEAVAEIARVVEFGPDKIIFREGEFGDTVYLIVEGRIAVDIFVPSRGRATVLTLGPGQLLGWSPLFNQKPNTATGRTLTSTRAIALEAAGFRSLCEKDHTLGCVIAWRVAEVIAGRLKATRLQLLDIFAHGT